MASSLEDDDEDDEGWLKELGWRICCLGRQKTGGRWDFCIALAAAALAAVASMRRCRCPIASVASMRWRCCWKMTTKMMRGGRRNWGGGFVRGGRRRGVGGTLLCPSLDNGNDGHSRGGAPRTTATKLLASAQCCRQQRNRRIGLLSCFFWLLEGGGAIRGIG